ncbi:hypothetical protein [Kutzneria sp. NPDC051319]|uniref:hypothetical protein n=1 Tax=Kutzneria sp. NPDC051319 TaxID=3155047 RepID=UPI0034186365
MVVEDAAATLSRTTAERARLPELAEVLAACAGHLTDELLTAARFWLAEGRCLDVARAVAFAVVHLHVPVTAHHHRTLVDALVTGGHDPVAVRGVEPARWPAALPFTFVDGGWSGDDRMDEAAVAAVADYPGGHGVWRAWRMPLDGSPWPAPKRVYLIQAGEQVDVVALTARTQQSLAAAGEPAPQVEAYTVGSRLAAYQLTVRRNGTLLWTCQSPNVDQITP